MIQYDGPALPSNASIKLGGAFGNDLYTIANIQAVNQAASIGIFNVILTRVMNRDFTEEESKYSAEFTNFLLEDCSNFNINQLISWESIQQSVSEI